VTSERLRGCTKLARHLTLALSADAAAAATEADAATCAISASASNDTADAADAVDGLCLTGALSERLARTLVDDIGADDDDDDDDETARNAGLEGIFACSAALFPALQRG
jgi:hypothetical protein